ncbi:putative disease resistance RPP13-like protein 1 [Ricinus communis]|uniref:Disease resistance protein RGA2, putative n=1 Tax=Ricinus communis TaxID=3988 RepID=B9SH62_RICCO|nr:putative disease resistance RPP13-like protein 1 [Ricinus communis]EEF37064.1 Disease resistance protein RGA2, putative [Ricinus communis]|eukprot:XP_002525331.1 putative disease resistance RPP13-like protein 1 [Ricinus communis]
MAGALIGGSFLSAFLQVLFDRMASREVLDFFKGQKLNDALLNKLKTTMISVNAVLDDAEEKQITKPAVKEWLDELKDAAYEADDLLDEIAYECLRSEVEATSQTDVDQVRNFFSNFSPFKKVKEVKLEEVSKLEEILERLELLVKQKEALGLREGIEERHSHKIPTTSLVDESVGIYGRDFDKKAIVKQLFEANGNDLSVIPIVGMGGVGKTTLAQYVYNEPRVQESFDLKAWVCVSAVFDVFKVTKDILEDVTRKKCDITTLNLLQLELKEKLKGKRFLLVLDDVWDDNYANWDVLRKPLKSGALGSKIIVTTRHETVASIMGNVLHHHHLTELSDHDCWLLFSKHAFGEGNSAAHPELAILGQEIVRKCRGLPLAAKALGGVLRSKRDTKEWERIFKSLLWELSNDEILPALRLSYHYLPPHLKRCFAYCAVFPKDYNFSKEELILLWRAEGFIVQPKGSREKEDVGAEYFEDLVSRSFFQKSHLYKSAFVMHDLINDLAKYVSGEFCFQWENGDSCEVAKRTRHLSYLRTNHDTSVKFESIYRAKHLRTLRVKWSWWTDRKVKYDLLPSLRRLRVLSLFQCDDVVLLPNTIGNLKHLRYLDLSGTSIKRLPDSINSLYNLETLLMYGCQDLIKLPITMSSLISLCHLDIRETKLQEMPLKMSKLTKLEMLTDFVLGKESGSSIKELGELQNLRGSLCIWNLQNVADAQDAMAANLKNKKHLRMLDLRWDGETDDSLHERAIVEQLQPHMNVESLCIVGYGGTRFPDWIANPTFSHMVTLELSRCKYCSFLPPLGQLVSLKSLYIIALDSIVSVGLEFYGSCTHPKKPFGSLEILHFERMPQWREWICHVDEGENGAFPLLQQLYINECPNLIQTLPGNLPSLTTIKIVGCPQLAASFPSAPAIQKLKLKDDHRNVLLQNFDFSSLKVVKFHSVDPLLQGMEKIGVLFISEEIEVGNCDSLKCFPLELFPELYSLEIYRCQNLECISEAEVTSKGLNVLESIKIRECPKLISFPKGGLNAPNLTSLHLCDCSNLKSLPECMHSLLPSLYALAINNCPKLESFPEGGLPPKLYSLVIESCDKLVTGRMKWNLQTISLKYFSISKNEDVESFPEKMLLPSTLTCLQISNFQNLKSLDYDGIQHLTSLTELTISNCPKLQSVTEQELPLTVTYLDIWDLQNLKSLDFRGLCYLTSLKELEIWNCPNLQSMPEDGLPSSLVCLTISNLQNLQSLNFKGLQDLTFLIELDILDCPKLESIPEEGLPTSLSSLIIYNCPSLKQRCKQEKGEDWPKISHIRHIEIDGDTMNKC